MIFLKVEEYCQNCPDFESDVDKAPTTMYSNSKSIGVLRDTFIKCKHRKRCENIKRYLEKDSKPKDWYKK